MGPSAGVIESSGLERDGLSLDGVPDGFGIRDALSMGMYSTFRRWIESFAHIELARRRSFMAIPYFMDTDARESFGCTC